MIRVLIGVLIGAGLLAGVAFVWMRGADGCFGRCGDGTRCDDHSCIAAVETKPAPHVPAAERITVDDLGYKDDRITHVAARFGYMDPQNIPALLPLIREADIERPLENEELSYFLSRIEIVLGNTPGMSRWRKRLFIATSQITADAAEVFQLPREQTLIVGSRIEL